MGDDARTVLAVYAHVLEEGQRRDHVRRLAATKKFGHNGSHLRVTSKGPSLGL